MEGEISWEAQVVVLANEDEFDEVMGFINKYVCSIRVRMSRLEGASRRIKYPFVWQVSVPCHATKWVVEGALSKLRKVAFSCISNGFINLKNSRNL